MHTGISRVLACLPFVVAVFVQIFFRAPCCYPYATVPIFDSVALAMQAYPLQDNAISDRQTPLLWLAEGHGLTDRQPQCRGVVC